MPKALLDFSVEYSMYSREFVNLVSATIERMDHTSKTYEVLQDNIHEEKGNVEESEADTLKAAGVDIEWIRGVTHKQLFLNVKSALAREAGVPVPEPAADGPGAKFLALMKDMCENKPTHIGLAVLGLATEALVPHMYRYIMEAVKQHTTISPQEGCFFPLHALCDEGHSVLLEAAVAEAATTTQLRREMGACAACAPPGVATQRSTRTPSLRFACSPPSLAHSRPSPHSLSTLACAP